ncbi:MAG: hypothetical protein NUV65_03130, partial [Candidatus Roizmanbacteria bacterium]|nr:hypothetical protein [Candidatus Roizmanbacteria bacterium]
TSYGIKIDDQATAGAFSIYTGTGLVQFGDDVTMTDDLHVESVITSNYQIDLNPVTKIATTGEVTVALAGVGAGNVDVGLHYYNVTYYTALGETEFHTKSSNSNATTTAGNGQVDITFPVSSDPRVIGRKIYRTAAGANYYTGNLLLATIADNTTTTYRDNIADSGRTGTTKYFHENTTHKAISYDGVTMMSATADNTVFGANNATTLFAETAETAKLTCFGQGNLGKLTTGTNPTALGYSCFANLTSGGDNIGIGNTVGNAITTGAYNVLIGRNVLNGQNAGSAIAIGYMVGGASTTGVASGNVFIGTTSAYLTNGATYCTFIGHRTGYNVTTSDYSIIIGAWCDLPSATANGQLNIGCVIFGTGMYDTNADSSAPHTVGKIGILNNAPLSTLDIGGSTGLLISNKTATFTADVAATVYICDATGGAIIANLPTVASAANRIYTFKRINAGANNITVTPNGAQTIDGAAALATVNQYDTIRIIAGATEWHVI